MTASGFAQVLGAVRAPPPVQRRCRVDVYLS